jgi:tRNA (guanine37-N1)-methyltransferase
MRIDILTLFPEVFEAFLGASIIGRARQAGLVETILTNIRDFTHDVHRTVDDKPYGGGPGMVLQCAPVFAAVRQVERGLPQPPQRILLTPQGRPLAQKLVTELAAKPGLLIICGHYEGFDERIRLGLKPLELSIGDYVLSGGEAAAMVLVDAVTRLLPDALGGEESLAEESFSDRLLEYPQYTRPAEFEGLSVPDILVSGDHGKVAEWRRQQRVERTAERRPDLLPGTPDNPGPAPGDDPPDADNGR